MAQQMRCCLDVRKLPTPLRILDDLRRRPEQSWTLDQVAEAEHIDRSVAFEHLEVLIAAGLATKLKVAGHRGRPANAYRYIGSDFTQPPQRTQLLAALLAQSLARSSEGASLARIEGRDFGSTVGDLERLGGEYVVDEHSVHALSCMFESSCSRAREVVCGLHAGLIEGALSAGYVKPEGPDGLGGCTFTLEEGRQRASGRI
jgi:predicted transcriptional regulator